MNTAAFVLIVLMDLNRAGFAMTQEFYTEEKCNMAKETILKGNFGVGAFDQVFAECFPK